MSESLRTIRPAESNNTKESEYEHIIIIVRLWTHLAVSTS